MIFTFAIVPAVVVTVIFCVPAPGVSVYINANGNLVVAAAAEVSQVAFVTPPYARVTVLAVVPGIRSPFTQTTTLWVEVVVSEYVVPTKVSLVAGTDHVAAVPLEALRYFPADGAAAADTSTSVVAVFMEFAVTILLGSVIVLFVKVWTASGVTTLIDSLASGSVPVKISVAFSPVILDPFP